MKNLIIASVVALSASLSFGMAPASAASIHIGPNGVRITEHHHRHHWRRHHHRHCYWKTVHKWHHHHRVVKRIQVCR